MSLNTSHTPDGRGVLIYNGEMILIYTKEVNLSFENPPGPFFKGTKKGPIYLTTHRIIFTNKDPKDGLQSFCMPFHCLRDVKLEQPIFGGNYLKGHCLAQPNGNFEGETVFKLTFNQGGCIDYGKALLRAADMAARFRPQSAPPPYAPPAGGYFSPPPAYYTAPGGNFNGFQAPTQTFPDQAPAENVFMHESPPPYPGIGPTQTQSAPYPAGTIAGQTYPQPQNGQPDTDLRQRHAEPSAPPCPSYDEAVRS